MIYALICIRIKLGVGLVVELDGGGCVDVFGLRCFFHVGQLFVRLFIYCKSLEFGSKWFFNAFYGEIQ